MGGRRRQRTVVLTWSGDDTTGDDKAFDEDKVIFMTGVSNITVQLVTPTVAAGVATFDLHTIGSNHADAGYTTTHFQDGVISAQAEDVVSSPIVLNQGPHYLKLRLDVNTAAPTAGEDVVAYVWIDYVE
jgi:hypothetical protein